MNSLNSLYQKLIFSLKYTRPLNYLTKSPKLFLKSTFTNTSPDGKLKWGKLKNGKIAIYNPSVGYYAEEEKEKIDKYGIDKFIDLASNIFDELEDEKEKEKENFIVALDVDATSSIKRALKDFKFKKGRIYFTPDNVIIFNEDKDLIIKDLIINNLNGSSFDVSEFMEKVEMEVYNKNGSYGLDVSLSPHSNPQQKNVDVIIPIDKLRGIIKSVVGIADSWNPKIQTFIEEGELKIASTDRQIVAISNDIKVDGKDGKYLLPPTSFSKDFNRIFIGDGLVKSDGEKYTLIEKSEDATNESSYERILLMGNEFLRKFDAKKLRQILMGVKSDLVRLNFDSNEIIVQSDDGGGNHKEIDRLRTDSGDSGEVGSFVVGTKIFKKVLMNLSEVELQMNFDTRAVGQINTDDGSIVFVTNSSLLREVHSGDSEATDYIGTTINGLPDGYEIKINEKFVNNKWNVDIIKNGEVVDNIKDFKFENDGRPVPHNVSMNRLYERERREEEEKNLKELNIKIFGEEGEEYLSEFSPFVRSQKEKNLKKSTRKIVELVNDGFYPIEGDSGDLLISNGKSHFILTKTRYDFAKWLTKKNGYMADDLTTIEKDELVEMIVDIHGIVEKAEDLGYRVFNSVIFPERIVVRTDRAIVSFDSVSEAKEFLDTSFILRRSRYLKTHNPFNKNELELIKNEMSLERLVGGVA